VCARRVTGGFEAVKRDKLPRSQLRALSLRPNSQNQSMRLADGASGVRCGAWELRWFRSITCKTAEGEVAPPYIHRGGGGGAISGVEVLQVVK
jgi:hypothetical protein